MTNERYNELMKNLERRTMKQIEPHDHHIFYEREAQRDLADMRNETATPMTASEMGKLGAQARIKATTSDQRKAWARKAGKASGKARRKKINATFERINVATRPTE